MSVSYGKDNAILIIFRFFSDKNNTNFVSIKLGNQTFKAQNILKDNIAITSFSSSSSKISFAMSENCCLPRYV